MADNPLLGVPLEERWVQLEIFAWFWSKKKREREREFLLNMNYPNYQSTVNMNSANKLDSSERKMKKKSDTFVKFGRDIYYLRN